MADKKKKVEINEETLAANEADENVTEAEVNEEAAEATENEETSEAVETDAEESDAPKDKKDQLIEELKDKNLRTMAEFENFRKRSEKEKGDMFDLGAKSVIEKILPVIDNFERGLATLSPEQKEEPFAQGMDKIYQQLLTELAGIGVEPIEALGCEFDPNLHNAVMQTQSEEYESGVIAQELQKGYKYHDTVVRHSMVAVVE